MSAAESDLLFPQLDSLMLADISNLSDYEDFSRDAFLLSDVDGFALADDFDYKSSLKPLLVAELNEFGSSLAGIKEEDEEEEKAGLLATCCTDAEDTESREKHLAVLAAGIGIGLTNESMQVDSVSTERNTLLSSNGDSCMSIDDAIAEPSNGELWHDSPFNQIPSVVSDFSESSITVDDSNSPLPLSAQSDAQIQQTNDVYVKEMISSAPLPCMQGSLPIHCSPVAVTNNGSYAERMPARTPSVFKINSPLSSPTSSVDRCSNFKAVVHDKNGSMHPANTSNVVQPAFIDAGPLPRRSDVYHTTLSHPIMQDGPPFSSMHRSQSSHALGQLRLSGQHGAYPKEFIVSPIHVAAVGYACPNNFTHYQPSCSVGLAERSPTTPMRRVFSTGDIQASHGMQSFYGENSPNCMERVSSEENMGLKVGHYTLEERKLRLHRYRQKRNERNFSKKIKYACRKTLADSRPRIRGRFARMLDDSGEPLCKDNDDDYEEADIPTLHCSVPHGRMVNFWNATGMNATIQHGH